MTAVSDSSDSDEDDDNGDIIDAVTPPGKPRARVDSDADAGPACASRARDGPPSAARVTPAERDPRGRTAGTLSETNTPIDVSG